MTDPIDVLTSISPIEEASRAELGDARRTKRYSIMVEALLRRPDCSVPEAIGDEAGLEAYYRLVRNPSVDDRDLFEPHFAASARRAEVFEHVLCIHDTTEYAFPVHDDEIREHLARPSTARQGFFWHSSILTTADGTRAPLGCVAARPFVHIDDCPDEETQAWWADRGGTFANEKWRWLEAVEESEGRLEDVADVTHVMDREVDDFETLVCMASQAYHFAVRMRSNRNVCTGERRKDYRKLKEALAEQPWRGHREVKLSPRPASASTQTHPMRRARTAKLRARAACVEIRRPDNVPAGSAPDRLELNVVQVREVNAPAGDEPVEWLLITTRPVETSEQVWQVVDWYRGRWITEEFYKAIKTGCSYKTLQHRSAKTLLCALAATTIVAHHLLVLRHLGRHAEDLPAEAVVTDLQLRVLQATKAKFLSDDPTAGEAMTAVAKLGGHITSNGDPGWQVLGRGWERLLEYEHAFALGMQAQEEM